jgi:hypothetical protein
MAECNALAGKMATGQTIFLWFCRCRLHARLACQILQQQQHEAPLARLRYKQECCVRAAMADKQQLQAAAMREKALANEAKEQLRHIAAKCSAALAEMVLAKEQCHHEEAEHAALSVASSLANEQRCHEAAACAAASEYLALTKEQHCHEMAMIAAMLAEKSLAKEQHCHEVAKQAAALAEQALTKEQHCHEAAKQAAASAEQALAEEQRCHEMAELAAMLRKWRWPWSNVAMRQPCRRKHQLTRWTSNVATRWPPEKKCWLTMPSRNVAECWLNALRRWRSWCRPRNDVAKSRQIALQCRQRQLLSRSVVAGKRRKAAQR